jgi:flagellin-like protein
MTKGISPLVASVLLIAITMTLAGAIAYWASSFVSTTLPPNQTMPTGECISANFRIYSCKYNYTSGLSMILYNLANVELKNLTLFVIYPNSSVQSVSLNDTLRPNDLKSFLVSGISSDYSTITVRTHCPQITESSACK